MNNTRFLTLPWVRIPYLASHPLSQNITFLCISFSLLGSGGDSEAGAIKAEATFSSGSAGIALDITGQYAVYVRWVVHPNRTDSARYRIYDGASTLVGSCTMNQMVRGGEWVYCDTVPMTINNAAVVRLGNNCEAGKYVVADAIRFVRVSKDAGDIVDEAGNDYARNSTQVNIASTDQLAPTQIINQSVTCPRSGYVVATATGQPYVLPAGAPGFAFLHFTLNTTNTWDQNNSQVSGRHFATADGDYRSLSITRKDSCSGGSTVTYYLVGFGSSNTSTASYLWQPTLSLTYFATVY